MADETTTKTVMSLIATSSDRIKDLPIKNGQMIFIQNLGRIALDFKGTRVFYNQIAELKTDAERQAIDSPLSGYYFVIDTAVLWFYQDEWIPITEKPQEIIFIGVELPELGVEKKIYVNKKAKEISVWDTDTSQYIVVADKTELEMAVEEDIDLLFA